jgi:hypothetical protein
MDFGDMTFTICYHKILLVLEEHAARYSETDFGTLKRKIVPSPPIRNLPCNCLTSLRIQNWYAAFLVSNPFFSCRILAGDFAGAGSADRTS